MPHRPFALIAILCVALALPPIDAAAQSFEPKVGQPGKDVIWVPTPDALVARMLDMAKATPQDYLVDLGSGDGRTVIAAAKRGIKALGIEYNADMVEVSKRNAEAAGVADRVKFIQGDIFTTDFSQATVVTMYLLSSLNLKLRPTLLNMKPGTRIVSHAFTMGDWSPDETASVEGYSAYLWIIPAKVQGRWQINAPGGPFELVLDQAYQKLTGKVSGARLSPNLGDPRLHGSSIGFTLVDTSGQFLRFKGTVNGDSMEGTVQAHDKPEARWTGHRSS
ncbi:MAG: class I SAM-dependent methyltransferase [Betaproteobacteria bacterium]|nr:MAG: class I SAM-dependent methyltransferase [Betaproteobacteria bacterium]